MQVERNRFESLLLDLFSGGRVSNTWVICLKDRDNRVKTLLIPDKLSGTEVLGRKGAIRFQMSPRLISQLVG